MKEIIIKPTLEDRKKDGYYFTHFYCSNCGRPNGIYDGEIEVMIPEGREIPIEKYICPNCKCETLTKPQ